jgi:hypothetical protein
MNYYQKYLKYKAKYLELKGGVSPQCETPAFNAWVSGLKNKKEVTREEERRIYGRNFSRRTLEKCIAERDPSIHLLPRDENIRAEIDARKNNAEAVKSRSEIDKKNHQLLANQAAVAAKTREYHEGQKLADRLSKFGYTNNEDVRADASGQGEIWMRDEINQRKEDILSKRKFSPKNKSFSEPSTSPMEQKLRDKHSGKQVNQTNEETQKKIQYCNNFIQYHTKNKQIKASVFYELLKDKSLNMTEDDILKCIKDNGVSVVIDNEEELKSGISWDELNDRANGWYDAATECENKSLLKGDPACQKIIEQRFKGRKVITQVEYNEVIADSKLGNIHFSEKTLDECLKLNGISVSKSQ